MKKYFVLLVAALQILTSAPLSADLTANAASSPYFTDINGHWAAPFIEKLQTTCQIEGYTDASGSPLHLFKPDAPITRGELVKMLVKCINPALTPPAAAPFPDVPPAAWYAPGIAKAKDSGWVNGYSDGNFRPMNPINRAEALKILLLSKFTNTDIAGGSNTFTDVTRGAWYEKFVTFAVSKQYVSGFKNNYGQPSGQFGPSRNITRAEVAKIIAKILGWDVTDFTPLTGSALIGSSCSIFPADNPWNRDISKDPLDANSANYINSIGASKFLHPDFGGNGEYGIPYTVVSGAQPQVPIQVVDYPSESDPGPYPIPANAPQESGSDHHIIIVDKDNCMLYELYGAAYVGPAWQASSAAKFNLKSNALRPDGWTSADAAGLPVFAGLVRYDEVATGQINHALRFTVSPTQKAFIHPATHYASSATDADLPPMGLRVRLKANFDTSKFTGASRVILEALKKYGMIVADNGSDWYITGSADPRWNDDDLAQLKTVPGSAFEAIQSGPLIKTEF